MGLKGQLTRASYIEWDSFLILIQKLERDREFKFLLLFSIGCYTGLRISDLLKLKWRDLLNQETLQITEGKTKKNRRIKINPNLSSIIDRVHKMMNILNNDELIFINKTKTKSINIQYVNRKLKDIAEEYKLSIPKNAMSSHIFRKTLGRHVWAMNGYSEKSLLLLGELFNHSSIKITKVYLGIKEEELGDIYFNL